jgi:hypothetical protein
MQGSSYCTHCYLQEEFSFNLKPIKRTIRKHIRCGKQRILKQAMKSSNRWAVMNLDKATMKSLLHSEKNKNDGLYWKVKRYHNDSIDSIRYYKSTIGFDGNGTTNWKY